MDKVVLICVILIIAHAYGTEIEKGTCSTTHKGRTYKIYFGETKWLNPCLFCWCYGASKEKTDPVAGCNTVDCPIIPCPPDTEMHALQGECCPTTCRPLTKKANSEWIAY